MNKSPEEKVLKGQQTSSIQSNAGMMSKQGSMPGKMPPDLDLKVAALKEKLAGSSAFSGSPFTAFPHIKNQSED